MTQFIFSEDSAWLMPGVISSLIVVAAIWSLAWKGVALYVAARERQKTWFVALLVLQTLGILDIVYLLFFAKKTGGSALTAIFEETEITEDTGNRAAPVRKSRSRRIVVEDED